MRALSFALEATTPGKGTAMPWKTKFGTHYHETYGCASGRATIPCDTKGLLPCSICCGGGAKGAGGSTSAGGAGAGSPQAGGQGAGTGAAQAGDMPAAGRPADAAGVDRLLATLGSDGSASVAEPQPMPSSSTLPELTPEEFAEELLRVVDEQGYDGHFLGCPMPDGQFVDEALAALTSDPEFMYAIQDALFVSGEEATDRIADGLAGDAELREEMRLVMDSPVAKTPAELAAERRQATIDAAEWRIGEIVRANAEHSGPGGGHDVSPAMVVSDQVDAFLKSGRTDADMAALHAAVTPEGRRHVLARQFEEHGFAPYAHETAELRDGMVRDALELLDAQGRDGRDVMPVTPHPTFHEANGRRYEEVPAEGYVDVLRQDGAEEVDAEKSARVLVTPSRPGDRIRVWVESGDHEVDEVVGEDHVVVTRCDDAGNPVLDEHGHVNTWTMRRETFEKKYDAANISPGGVARPRGGRQRFIRTDRDVVLMVPWGEGGALVPQHIAKGGWLNVTSLGDVYGIAEAEFAETYGIVE